MTIVGSFLEKRRLKIAYLEMPHLQTIELELIGKKFNYLQLTENNNCNICEKVYNGNRRNDILFAAKDFLKLIHTQIRDETDFAFDLFKQHCCKYPKLKKVVMRGYYFLFCHHPRMQKEHFQQLGFFRT